MSLQSLQPTAFSQLGLSEALLLTLEQLGYHTPSPIQAKAIPEILNGVDIIGQAQTGTGKTAAFALPVVDRIDLKRRVPQALVLAPTRELAMQVTAAFKRYGAGRPSFNVLCVYGGQSFYEQRRGLERGAHIVVGTPGRVMDHMRRGTLAISNLEMLVLDEADEMLRMGFVEDIKWIIEQIPSARQTALFSATMPPPIRAIAQQYLRTPSEIRIEAASASASTIRQRYWLIDQTHKLDALSRILEVEQREGVLVFTRTKLATVTLAEQLCGRGFHAGAINGDMLQPARERVIDEFKKGKLDILVATDVAARGLDVDRVSHVINYDIPFDSEAYVHRIGRTGRAGRHGEAIVFVARRERRMMRQIEAASGGSIEPMSLPSASLVNEIRRQRLKAALDDVLSNADVGAANREQMAQYTDLFAEFADERGLEPIAVAALVAKYFQGDNPLFLPDDGSMRARSFEPGGQRERKSDYAAPISSDSEKKNATKKNGAKKKFNGAGPEKGEIAHSPTPPKPKQRREKVAPQDKRALRLFRVAVGSRDGAKPGNLVAAIASESGLDPKFIGRISIFENHSTIELPGIIPKDLLNHLKDVQVAGRKLMISAEQSGATGRSPSRPKGTYASAKKKDSGGNRLPKKAPRSGRTRKS